MEPYVLIQCWQPGSNQYWTSLNDLDQENVFVWDATGEYLCPGYVNWDQWEPEPNGWTGYNCVVMDWFMDGWCDEDCARGHHSICEWQAWYD